MSKLYTRTIYILSALLLFVLLGGPQMAYAWTMPQQSSTSNTPSATLPNAPSAEPQPADAQPQSGDQQQQPAKAGQKDQAPLGAAAAESARTAGGAASRPAGAALAPAKQGQKRGLLIKLGLVAAGAAAIGAVYGLTRATGSTPPGAGR